MTTRIRAALRLSTLVAICAGLLAAALIWRGYVRDMAEARRTLASASEVLNTPRGDIEYATWGEGPPALALHGAGGGHDQGRILADALGGDGFRWIAPSRFGYLRSTLPPDASTAAQAEAIVALLDHLGVDRVAVLAMSGGAPPALQLAIAHPERVTALVLLSTAPFTPLTADAQDLPIPAWLYQALFASDFPFWALHRLAPGLLAPIFDAVPDPDRPLTAEDQAFVAALTDGFLPVTDRVPGLRNEGAAIDPQARYPLSGIAAPTLVIHARDDAINPFAIGAYAAAGIPGAEMIALDAGGHLLLGSHPALRERIGGFLRPR